MRIERHVFGSIAGYTTLARSPGLGPDDARQLEATAFAFGQTGDRGFLKGLRRNPAWFTRTLRGGRRGLTRVLEGTPDDNGRPTLLMVTAVVVQRDWDSELCGDVDLLLDDADVWAWDGTAAPPALDRSYPLPSHPVPRRSVPKVLALLSELEHRQGSGGQPPIVVSAGEYGPAEMRALELLIPPPARPQFASGCRALSASLAVNANALAAEADAQAITFRFDPAGAPSPYARFLQGTSLASGGLPLSEVMGYRAFGRREAAAAAAAGHVNDAASAGAPPTAAATARPSAAWIAGMLLLGLLLGAGGFYAGRQSAPGIAGAIDLPRSQGEAPPAPSTTTAATFPTTTTTGPTTAVAATRPSPPTPPATVPSSPVATTKPARNATAPAAELVAANEAARQAAADAEKKLAAAQARYEEDVRKLKEVVAELKESASQHAERETQLRNDAMSVVLAYARQSLAKGKPPTRTFDGLEAEEEMLNRLAAALENPVMAAPSLRGDDNQTIADLRALIDFKNFLPQLKEIDGTISRTKEVHRAKQAMGDGGAAAVHLEVVKGEIKRLESLLAAVEAHPGAKFIAPAALAGKRRAVEDFKKWRDSKIVAPNP